MSNFKYITKSDKMKDQFYQIPKQFMLESKYKKMKDSSKILYSILYSRTSLSVQNNWFDENERAYIICTYDEMQVLFGCSRDKVSSCIKDLKKFDLIKVDKIKNENNDTINVIYIAHVETTKETLDALITKHKSDYHKLRDKNREYKREYNKKQSEINKNKRKNMESEKQTTIENTTFEPLKFTKPSNINGSLKNRLRVVRKSDYSNTELSYTDNCMYVCTSEEDTQLSSDLLLELQRKASSKSDPTAWLNKTVTILKEKEIYDLNTYKDSLKEFSKQFKKIKTTNKIKNDTPKYKGGLSMASMQINNIDAGSIDEEEFNRLIEERESNKNIRS